MQQCCIKNMSELLKHKSIRITDFRIKVLEVFEKHTNAISVKTIENELVKFDRTTLFRTLNTFVDKGIIHPISLVGSDTKYGLCLDECSNDNHEHNHVHLDCKSCNEVYCIDIESLPTLNLGNHKIDSVEIQASGICEKCLLN